MPPQRETATDRLADVIEVAQLGQKTGLLTVERGNGITLEEGSITFVDGQVTEASAGGRNGLEALNWLNTWGACRFAFVSSAVAGDSGLHIPIASSSPASTGRNLWTQEPTTNGQVSWLANEGRNSEGTGNATIPAAPYRTKQIDEALRLIEHTGLSRTHRRLFLLVDGQRTALELGRLLGRDQHEVYRLLYDLERVGVIHRHMVQNY
jgi:Domain of unknown function (DUF4388)